MVPAQKCYGKGFIFWYFVSQRSTICGPLYPSFILSKVTVASCVDALWACHGRNAWQAQGASESVVKVIIALFVSSSTLGLWSGSPIRHSWSVLLRSSEKLLLISGGGLPSILLSRAIDMSVPCILYLTMVSLRWTHERREGGGGGVNQSWNLSGWMLRFKSH